MAAGFEPAAFKSDQRDNWNDLSVRWDRWHSVFEAGTAPVTANLLEQGRVVPGARVLDVASGTGEPALSAAGRVGPTGQVIGVDLAAEMVAVARRRGAGRSNLTYQEGDAEALDLSDDGFDTVLTRFGLMFLPDRSRALTRILELLRPGGRLAGATWSVPPRVPVIGTAFAVIAATLELPPSPPGLPGPFSMADPHLVAAELTEAGFTGATAEEMALTFRYDSVAEFVEFSRDLLPARVRNLIRERIAPADEPALWKAVGAQVEQYTEKSGAVAVPSTAICFHATKPATR